MLQLLIVISSLFIGSFGVDVGFSFGSTCFSEGTRLELTAEYNGTGDVTAIQWYYSGQVSNNMLVIASTCDTPGAVPAGYPDKSRMTFDCDLATNIFKLTLSSLQAEELDKSWGATFTLSVGLSPDVEQKQIIVCTKCTCDCKCKKKCTRIVIPSIVFGSLGVGNLPIVIGGAVSGLFGRTTALVVDFLGIVCDVLGMVIGIVVEVEDCCEDAADCCEDSDCCEVECDRNWIENTALAFIVIGCLVGIVAVVIFYLVWSNRMGPGNNGGNGFFCFNNGSDGGDDGGNDGGNNGHHRGHGTNSSTVHSERADTHRGTLSDRANSEGEVSRKDVHVQENRDNFSGRPMPPIPLTDKKGRGLSANYDDDHPMINVGIPERRAGDLGPLAEEPKKKKKKKKKAVNDDDV